MKNTQPKPSFPHSREGMPTGLKSSRAHDQAAKPQPGMDSHGRPWEPENGRPWKPEKREKQAE